MSSSSAGLYSDDGAADLRPALRMLRRLPLSGDEIIDRLLALNPWAESVDDADGVTFWLVVADQLHGAGIESRATAKVLDLIHSGAAIAAAEDQGMEPRHLRKRRELLGALAERLANVPPDKKRRVLKKPQPLLFEPGEVYAFPVGTDLRSINPYNSDARIEATFVPTGWSSMLVSGAGHEFDFLAWYRFAPSRCFSEERPDFATAASQIDAEFGNVGTMSATGRRRLRFELLGRLDDFVPVESDPVRVSYAVAHDISVANLLSSSRTRS